MSSRQYKIDSKLRDVFTIPSEKLREWEQSISIVDEDLVDPSNQIRQEILDYVSDALSENNVDLCDFGLDWELFDGVKVEFMLFDVSEDELASGGAIFEAFHLEGYSSVYDGGDDVSESEVAAYYESLDIDFTKEEERIFFLFSWTYGGGETIANTEVHEGQFEVDVRHKLAHNFTEQELDALEGVVRSTNQGQVIAVRGGEDIHTTSRPFSTGYRILVRIHF